ncbi:hypothetical protein LINPERPRIM_LOCUS1068 [Linum perenne]
MLKKVPPTLITPQGVSSMASQVGQPIKKYIRDGMDVKVCVIKDVSEETKTSPNIVLARGEKKTIAIEYPEPRSYKRRSDSVWTVKAKAPIPRSLFVFVLEASSSGNASQPQLVGRKHLRLVSRIRLEGVGNGSKASLQADDSPIQHASRGLSPRDTCVEEGVVS